MSTFIEFGCEWTDLEHKVKAIKLLRHATNCGLKEGKDIVEACEDRVKRWRMTPAQFGLFVADYLDRETPSLFFVCDVKTIEVSNDIADFTTI